MKLNNRIEALEQKNKAPFKCYMILLNAYSLPYVKIKKDKAFFKSQKQFDQFCDEFKGENRLLIFRTIYPDQYEHDQVPEDAVFIEGWNNDGNFKLNNSESYEHK